MATRRIAPKRVANLQRKYLRRMGATPAEIRRYLPILTAQIGAESNFTEGIGSPAGAQDIAQFMPGTAKGYGVTLHDNRIKDDIRGQVRMMLPLLRKYGVEDALRAYNAGPGAIDASRGYSETNQYVKRVRGSADEYRFGAGGPGQSNRAGLPSASPGGYTIPGVDNSPLRQQAMLGYLEERGKPGALLDLKANLDAAQDVPSQFVRSRRSKSSRTTLNSGPGNSRIGGELYELIWRGAGAQTVKDGQRVNPGFYTGHKDHVHVAAAQKNLKKIGRIAERMGLHVGENPAFDPVDPVHVQGSYHYGRRVGKRMIRAIDVSGDPAKMAKFAKRVARLYGV